MSDIVTGQIFTDGEKGITATKLNNVVAQSVIQSDFYLNKASSATLDPTDQLLELKGTGSYARITGSQLISSVSSQIDVTPQIYSARLRSFNAVGNPNFEVDQRWILGGVANPPSGTFIQDRWVSSKAGTMAVNWNPTTGYVLVPGTNFNITRTFLRCTLTTQQVTLAAGDYLTFYQAVEGPQWRELAADVTSISLLVRSSVAGLKFGLSFRDGGSTVSLTKLCTISSANTWTLITLNNLPVPSGGTFSYGPNQVGYTLMIGLAGGTTYTATVNDTWQNGTFFCAAGQSNFCASPVNSTLDIAFVQHEPGAVCTTLLDKPFSQNYDEVLRYYQKSWNLGTSVGTGGSVAGFVSGLVPFGTLAYVVGIPGFQKPMVKPPTVAAYNSSTGVVNSIYNTSHATNHAVSSIAAGEKTISYVVLTAGVPEAGDWLNFHYTADTGW